MLKVLLFVILLGLPVAGFAQDDWQQTYRQLSDVEDVESEQWEEAFELLSDLEREPIDINSASREELEALPFLTDQQVEEIMTYRHRHGELLTPAELQMIRSLDYAQRQLLLQFISFGQRAPKTTWPRLDSLLRWGKQEVTASLRVPFYQRRGDRNGYLGYRYRHTVRYKFRCGQRLQFGLTGAQDAGFSGIGMMFVFVGIIIAATLVTGSGNAAFFAFVPLAPKVAALSGLAPVLFVLPMNFVSNLARSMSPIAAVMIVVAGAAHLSPMDLAKRTFVPVAIAAVVNIGLTLLLFF